MIKIIIQIREEIPDLIEISPEEEGTPEEITESLLSKLSFPEVTAFDYELAETAATETNAYRIPTGDEDLSAPVEPIQTETVAKPESEPAEEQTPIAKVSGNQENPLPESPEEQPETKKPEDSKPTTPTFDLELID